MTEHEPAAVKAKREIREREAAFTREWYAATVAEVARERQEAEHD